ncbi:MAG TPA: hypothetical protein VLV54_01735 [Thermoanaerobaculia bacterium]|nr:hypothetical protein [Thermoanaerobaculia bacterium]
MSGKKTLSFVAAALSMTAACTLSASAQPECSPGAPVQIEVLPPLPSTLHLAGDTCAPGLLNTVARYTSLTCRINGDYSKPEAIYKVWLHDGNNVKFNLAVQSGDLALALISTCAVGNSCVSSSDNLNPSPPPPSPPPASEELRSQNYKPGFYFLYHSCPR